MLQHHTDSVLLDGKLIRERLSQLCLSQVDLARKVIAATAGKPAMVVPREDAESARRMIQRAINGQRIHHDTANHIAQCLDVPFRHLRIVETQRGDFVADLVHQIEECDRHGEFERAAQVGEKWLNDNSEAHPDRATVCTALAAVYDHSQQWNAGIELLSTWLDRPILKPDITVLRGHYQRAVIRRSRLEDVLHRTLGKLSRERIQAEIQLVREDLSYVRDHSEVSMQVSVDHQLAVLELLLGHHSVALQIFEDCLKRRKKEQRSRPDQQSLHRIAYEHRRIAQCQAMLGEDPTNALNAAQKIAEATEHRRLLHEIHRDRHAWSQLQD